MTCTITSQGFELLLAMDLVSPERFPKNALSVLKCNLLEILWSLIQKGYTDFYTNAEYGIPLWTAEMICALKMYHKDLHLYLVIPYEEHYTAWKPEIREKYLRIRSQADGFAYADITQSPKSIEKANRIMCDSSDLLVIFGTRSTNQSMVSYAGMQDVPVFSLLWENLLIP